MLSTVPLVPRPAKLLGLEVPGVVLVPLGPVPVKGVVPPDGLKLFWFCGRIDMEVAVISPLLSVVPATVTN